jgi:hypothetical protein
VHEPRIARMLRSSNGSVSKRQNHCDEPLVCNTFRGRKYCGKY